MGILKKILMVLLILVVLFLGVTLFLPSSFYVERSIVINMPVDSVFVQVNDLNNFMNWNPWAAMDPEAKNDISNPSYGVGSSWNWDGKIVMQGSLVREEVADNKFIKSRLMFEDEANPAFTTWNFKAKNGSTNVSWSMEGDLDYPVGRIIGLMMDGMMGPDFEKGLASLKERAEKM